MKFQRVIVAVVIIINHHLTWRIASAEKGSANFSRHKKQTSAKTFNLNNVGNSRDTASFTPVKWPSVAFLPLCRLATGSAQEQETAVERMLGSVLKCPHLPRDSSTA
jgi:hypothetical protein